LGADNGKKLHRRENGLQNWEVEILVQKTQKQETHSRQGFV